jgi:hypothetical protein
MPDAHICCQQLLGIGVQLKVGLDSGPEGRQNVATPARAWIESQDRKSHGVAKNSRDESVATLWLYLVKNTLPTADAVGYTLPALRA